MGGFSVLLLLFVLWPMLLLAQVLLSLLNVAMPVVAAILLVWNIIVTAILLLIRRAWKAGGTMDRSYIDSQTGRKRTLLLVLRYGLVALVIWEALLILACAAYLIWRPDLAQLFWGLWSS